LDVKTAKPVELRKKERKKYRKKELILGF